MIKLYGTPRIEMYTPSAAVEGETVVVVGTRPLIAPVPFEANEKNCGLEAGGGVYSHTIDGAAEAGDIVYWDATAGKLTKTTAEAPHFGVLAAGSPEATDDGDTVYVLHDPDGSAIPAA